MFFIYNHTFKNVLDARLGPYFLPKYEGLGQNCWDEGCDYNDSLKVCRDAGGTIAKIQNRRDNQMIHWLFDKLGLGQIGPGSAGDFFMFYIGLKEMGNDYYMWEDGSEPTFFNW